MRLLKKWTNSYKSDLANYVDLLPLPALLVVEERIRFINKDALDMFGGDNRKQILGKSFLEFFTANCKKKVKQTLLNPVQLELKKFALTVSINNLDNETHTIEMRASNLHFNGKQAFLIVAQDKSQHFKIEEELGEKNYLIEKIAQTIPDIIYVTDIRNNESIFENLSLLEYLGYDEKMIKGNKWAFLFSRVHPDDMETIKESSRKLQTSTNDRQFVETEYRLKDAQNNWKWIYSRSRVFKRSADGKPLQHFGIAHDITALKNTQQRLDEKINELRNKNGELEKYITSNRELEKYAYIASHDLKEPLRTIIGFSQLLEKKFLKHIDAEAREYIDHIIEGTKRMETLVKGLLTYSRVESEGQPFQETDLNEMMTHVVRDLDSAIKRIDAKIRIDKMPSLHCDNLQIRQLFQNLLSNSLKFKSEVPLEIEIGCKEIEGGWQFHVNDNGIGLDMLYKDKIFEIFNRLHTKDKYPGAGIGLSICKRIVERHNGKIWLDSELGKGTTFFFTLIVPQ